MMSVTRRNLLKGVATAAVVAPVAAPFIGAGRAMAAEFSYKFANNLPVDHPINARMKAAVERIKEETGGRVAINIFPNNQLGSDTDLLSQVRSGGVEFFTLSGLILSTLVPVAAINGVGFAFKNHDDVWKAMDGELGTHVRDAIKKSGLHVMDKIWDNGFRQITTSTKPIQTAADLDAMKIRVPPSPLWTSMFKALGAAPASINWNEVYSSLQTKLVDGQENPLSTIATGKLYEVQTYCSLTNHMWDGFWFLGNRRAWASLPDDVRPVVEKHINAAAMAERDDMAKLNASLRTDLEGKGLAFNTPDAASIRDRLRTNGFYAEWKGKFGDDAWNLLEKVTGKLA